MPAVGGAVLRGRVGGAWRPWGTPSIRWGVPSNLRGTVTTGGETARSDPERVLRLLRDFVPTGVAFPELSYVGSESAAVDGDRWYVEAFGLTVERDSSVGAASFLPFGWPIPAGWKLASQPTQWQTPRYVWAFLNGAWKLVWAREPSAPLSPTATLLGDGTVEITWTGGDPEAATAYDVRRADGTLVATVTATGTGSAYSVVDTAPLLGANAYTITPKIGSTLGAPVLTNPVGLDVLPDSITVTYTKVDGVSRATIEWSAVPPAGVSASVLRPDGSVLVTGLDPATTAGVVDESPNPTDGTTGYTLVVFTASGQSAEIEAAGEVVAQAPGSLVAFDAATGSDDVALTWALTGVGIHDGVTVYRDGVAIATLPEDSTSYSDTNGSEGTVHTYSVRAVVAGAVGPVSNSDTAAVPANPPTSVTAAATSTVSQGKLTWGNPAGARTGYRVEVSENGSTWTLKSSDASSGITHNFSGDGGVRYFRVRTESDGGPSEWVERSFTPLWDSTPPNNSNVTSFKPESSYGRMVVRHTVTNDTDQYRVRYRTNGGSETIGSWINVFSGGVGRFSRADVVRTGSSGQKIEVRIEVRDAVGNSRIGSWYNYTLKPSVQDIIPVSSGHWRSGVYGANTSNPTRPYQGYFSDPSFDYVGMFYYGTRWRDACNAQGSFGGKVTVTRMTFIASREGGGVNRQDCVNVGTHLTQNNPGNVAGGRPAVFNTSCIMTLAYGETKEANLTSSHLASLRDGTSWGIAVQNQPYLFLFPAGTNFCGFGKVYSLG
jgi:hypothetical protein